MERCMRPMVDPARRISQNKRRERGLCRGAGRRRVTSDLLDSDEGCMISSKRILVTGGAGHLGTHLCRRLLQDGHHVICFDGMVTGREDNLASLMESPRFR